MAQGKDAKAVVVKHAERESFEFLLDTVPLGHMQAVILKTVTLVSEVSNSGSCSIGSLQYTIHGISDRIVDVAQIYGAMRKLEKDGLVDDGSTRSVERHSKSWVITEQGKEVLARSARHHADLARYLLKNEEEGVTMIKALLADTRDRAASKGWIFGSAEEASKKKT